MIWVITGLLAVYVVLILVLWFSWNGIPKTNSSDNHFFVSVIVAIRNESENILETLQSILDNDFPKNQFEIIVVDDHSTDDSVEKVQDLNNPQIRLVQLGKHQQGKKSAISLGISTSNGELMLCTDGDTLVGQQWIQRHVCAYSEGAKLSFGPVQYAGKGGWLNLLNLELLSLVGVGGAMLNLGYPSMINGCNYSFSKKAFIAVGGFTGNENLATGDDEFLLRKIHQKFPKAIKFLKEAAAKVSTLPVSTFSEFYFQRKRWASKWKHHKDLSSKALPVSVFLFYLLFYMGLVWISIENLSLSLWFLWTKLAVDFLFVWSVGSSMKMKVNVLSFLILQIIYPFYAVFFGLASNFGQYRWKERNHDI